MLNPNKLEQGQEICWQRRKPYQVTTIVATVVCKVRGYQSVREVAGSTDPDVLAVNGSTIRLDAPDVAVCARYLVKQTLPYFAEPWKSPRIIFYLLDDKFVETRVIPVMMEAA